MSARLAERAGGDAERARLAAKVGVACIQAAFDGWVADPSGPGFAERVDAAFAELRALG